MNLVYETYVKRKEKKNIPLSPGAHLIDRSGSGPQEIYARAGNILNVILGSLPLQLERRGKRGGMACRQTQKKDTHVYDVRLIARLFPVDEWMYIAYSFFFGTKRTPPIQSKFAYSLSRAKCHAYIVNLIKIEHIGGRGKRVIDALIVNSK